MRGTFANIRISNKMVPGVEGGMTRYVPTGETHADLRRGDGIKADGHAAGRHRRQGIWHRLVARLGGQGHQPARRPRGASPRASSASTAPTWSAWACSRCSSATARAPRPTGSTAARPSPIAGVAELEPRQEIDGQGDPRRRHRPSTFAARVPDRYRQRARIFPRRRHPPVCAAGTWRGVSGVDLLRRDRRLDRRGADPARLSAAVDGQADRPVARSISG